LFDGKRQKMTSFDESQPASAASYTNWSTVKGVRDDVNLIVGQTLKLFDDTQTLRIQHFQTVWKSMKFGLIFHGRQSYRELYEFTEDLLAYTRKLALSPYGFGNRAAAVYLLYTLYFKQPCRPKVRIRVEYEQYEDFCQWIDELRSGCHWELVYCWAKMVSDSAFTFVASTKPVGLENSGRNQDRVGVNEESRSNKKGSFPASTEPILNIDSFSEILEKLTKAHNQYTNMKKGLQNMMGDDKYDSGLSQTSEYFPIAMREIFSNPKASEKQIGGNILKENGLTIGQRRQRMIDKSYGSNVIENSQEESNIEIPDDVDEEGEIQPKGKSIKGKGKKRKLIKLTDQKITIDPNQDLKILAQSLAAVKEDPSLLIGMDDGDIILPKKKSGRCRPPKIRSLTNDDPTAVVSRKNKVKKKIKKKKLKKDPEFSEETSLAEPFFFDI
jgi:hypothetical protein